VVAYDLGILLVHGIGQQRRGDTLVNFGEPLHEWLERWLTHDKPGKPVVNWTDARLRPAEEAPGAPPHAAGTWTLPKGTSTVLLAECWWSDCFAAPSFGELFVWLREAALVTLSLHFGARLRRQAARFKSNRGFPVRKVWEALKVARELAYFLIGWPLLALFLLIFLVLMMVVNVIPGAGKLAQRIQFIMAATVGDSYAFLKRPIQRSAVTGQFHRDLRWVSDRSDRVAIVAHSQGAAVTHLALRQGLPAKLTAENCALITFGSGLKKLEELAEIREKKESLGSATLGGLLLMLTGAWFKGWLPVPRLAGDWDSSLWGVLMFIGGLLWIGDVLRTSQGVKFEPGRFKLSVLGKSISWMDLYAFSDPVSNGPLFSPSGAPDYLESQEVHNRNSNLSDHTSYWENAEQFTTRVGCALARLLGSDLSPDRDQAWIKLAGERRYLRVTALGWSRALATISSAALLVALGLEGRLGPWGELCLREIAGLLNAPRWSYVAEKFNGLREWLDPALFAAVLIAAMVFIGFRLTGWIWSVWQAHELDLFYGRKPYEPFNTRAAVFVAAVSALVSSVAAVGMALLPLPGETPLWNVGRVIAHMILPGAVAGVVLVATETHRDDVDTGCAVGLTGFAFALPWMLIVLRTPLVNRNVELLSDWIVAPLLGIAVGSFLAARWLTARFRALGRSSAELAQALAKGEKERTSAGA
jgi:hypothetical protein